MHSVLSSNTLSSSSSVAGGRFHRSPFSERPLADPRLSIRVAAFHSSLMGKSLPLEAPARSMAAFREALERARPSDGLRRFALDAIDGPRDYAELASRFVYGAGVSLRYLHLDAPLEGTVRLRFARGRRLGSHQWVQQGRGVAPAFFEAIDFITQPEGRFVRFDAGAERYLGLYLPGALAELADELLAQEAA